MLDKSTIQSLSLDKCILVVFFLRPGDVAIWKHIYEVYTDFDHDRFFYFGSYDLQFLLNTSTQQSKLVQHQVSL